MLLLRVYTFSLILFSFFFLLIMFLRRQGEEGESAEEPTKTSASS